MGWDYLVVQREKRTTGIAAIPDLMASLIDLVKAETHIITVRYDCRSPQTTLEALAERQF